MSSENKVEDCFKCPLENEVFSSFTSPVVLHWGLGCLGDIFGCLSSGGTCAHPEKGLGCWIAYSARGAPTSENWPDPLRSPDADGAWEEPSPHGPPVLVGWPWTTLESDSVTVLRETSLHECGPHHVDVYTNQYTYMCPRICKSNMLYWTNAYYKIKNTFRKNEITLLLFSH